MKRIYANEYYHTSNDVRLLKIYKKLVELQSNNYEFYKKAYKFICNKIRKDIGTKNIILIVRTTDETEIGVFEFNHIATEDNYYPAYYDAETDSFYTEIEEEEENKMEKYETIGNSGVNEITEILSNSSKK